MGSSCHTTADPERPSPQTATRRVVPRTRPTVLVIDDDEAFRELLALQLGERYRVLVAPSALRGLALAEWERPDVILLDIMMPAVSGIELLQVLERNARLRGTPVVVVTVYPLSVDTEAAAALRHWPVLQKPFQAQDLLRCIERALGAA